MLTVFSWPPRLRPATSVPDDVRPWPALFALCLGFFMILVDTTIVTVATPAIIEDLARRRNSVVWVTSAYLLAYAVPLLITGRLGDRFGPKNVYLVGLTVFTLASLWCGLTDHVEMLIIARVVQGFGAALMTPQTMAVITRIFPADRARSRRWRCGAPPPASPPWSARSSAASWSTRLGWEWIFFINVPVGLIGFVARRAPGADAADPRPQLRLARRRAQRARHVPRSSSASRRATSTTGAPSGPISVCD